MALPKPRRRRPASGLVVALILGGACSSSLQPNSDGGPDAAPPSQDGPPPSQDGPGSTCSDIQQAYAVAVLAAQECTVGAADQCGVQVVGNFWCNCMTYANGGADTLMAIANQYRAAGCQSVCNGSCTQLQTLSCQADATSPTGGRCQRPMLLNLTGTNDGAEVAVPVGYEIDILLQSIGNNAYANQVILSSEAATVIEIAIPAGTTNPGGPTTLYRLKALSPGQVVVQIPRLSGIDASVPAFMITLDIS
jgi:hypothetical protein